MAAPEEPPPISRNGARAPRTLVLVIGDPIDRADVPALCTRFRTLVQGSDAGSVLCDVRSAGRPDMVIVETLVSMQLEARRLGRRLRLRHAGAALGDLLALLGLGKVLPVESALLLEPQRQAEEREQVCRVEEKADPTDRTV